MSKQSDLLEAVSVADRVGELQFTVGQVCRMAGITKMQLEVRGKVPGIDQTAFAKAAEEAKNGCPVSNALKGNVPFELSATLEK